MGVIQELRDVSGFDEILFETSGEIFLKQGETEEHKIEADSELLPRLRSEVKNGRLEIRLQQW